MNYHDTYYLPVGAVTSNDQEVKRQRLIRLPQVKYLVGLGTTSIYIRMKKGVFPKPIKLGRLSGWIEAEIQAWIDQQIQQSRNG